MDEKIGKHLKNWFVTHFIIDITVAIPLLLFPTQVCSIFGFVISETLFPRLVAAALIGIGGVSYFARKHGKDSFKSLLVLKIFWSWAAIAAILMSIYDKQLIILYVILGVFVLFNIVWTYYLIKLNSKK
jgi:hypothetical protein